jgi:hypothetical protein
VKWTLIGIFEHLFDTAELPICDDDTITENASGSRKADWQFRCGFMADMGDGAIRNGARECVDLLSLDVKTHQESHSWSPGQFQQLIRCTFQIYMKEHWAKKRVVRKVCEN